MFPTVLRLLCPVVALTGATALRATISVERSVGEALVERIAHLAPADLVILDAGIEAGLRQGMVCTVSRDGRPLGELLLVDLRPRAASALILELAPGQSLQPGDSVAVKTASSRK